jgi:replicative DNA helicase
MIVDVNFLREYSGFLKPELFNDDTRVQLAYAALYFFKDCGCAAKNLYFDYLDRLAAENGYSDAKVQLLKEKAADIMVNTTPNSEYITKRLKDYFEFAKVKLLHYQLTRSIDDGDVKGAIDSVKVAQIELKKGEAAPVDFFETIPTRINRREVIHAQEDGVYLNIPTLDKNNIYAHNGEITLCIAPSKRGKSICLTHAAKCALLQNHTVLHISLENPLQMVEDRYDAMLSNIEIDSLRMGSDKLRNRVEYIRDIIKGKLFVLWRMAKTYSTSDLRADITSLRRQGHKIDVVIIDYGELMKPTGKFGGEAAMRAIRDDIFAGMRAVASDMGFVCITAQQTPLKKRKQFRIYMEDGQESSMPAQHSSLIITLNQTPDEEKANEMRLYVDGYWHGVSGTRVGDILVKQNFDKMQFCVKEIPISQGVEASNSQANP